MKRFAVELILIAVAGLALGLGIARVEDAFGIPKNVVQWFWIGLLLTALGFAAWAAWGYYRAIHNDDDQD